MHLQLPIPQLLVPSICDTTQFDSLVIHFFQTQTLPELQLVFRSELWEDHTLLAIGHSYPAILHLVSAISIYHKAFVIDGSMPSHDGGTLTSKSVVMLRAFNHSAKAARFMQEAVGSTSPDLTTIKLGCILFTLLEFVKGNRAGIMEHLTHGMEVLNLARNIESSDAHGLATDTILSSMSLSQCLYGRPRNAQFPTLHRTQRSVQCGLELDFRSLAEARCALVDVSAAILVLVRKVLFSPDAPTETHFIEQYALSTQLEKWSTRTKSLLTKTADYDHHREFKALHIQYDIATIFLAYATTRSELAFDHHLEVFNSVVKAAEDIAIGITVTTANPRNFSFDLGLIPSLFFTAIKCRDRLTRRKAIALLRRVPVRDGVWNATESALIAEHAMLWEESKAGNPMIGTPFLVPDSARIYDVDVDEQKDILAPLTKLTFWYKPDSASQKFEQTILFINSTI